MGDGRGGVWDMRFEIWDGMGRDGAKRRGRWGDGFRATLLGQVGCSGKLGGGEYVKALRVGTTYRRAGGNGDGRPMRLRGRRRMRERVYS